MSLMYASADLKNDKEVVLAAVKQDGYSLAHASDDLANDKEVVLAAVSMLFLGRLRPENDKRSCLRRGMAARMRLPT